MDEPRVRKLKTIQIKYPAPYSRSWTSPETGRKADKPKKKSKKNSSSLQQNLFSGCCRRSKPKPLHGSDPYAPHLKYGIFPHQIQKARNPLNNVNANISLRNTTDPLAASELINNKENKSAKMGQLSDTPLFVIRPIDKRHRRQLTMSETLHLDIKPRKNANRSPARKYSPIFKKTIPKISKNEIY